MMLLTCQSHLKLTHTEQIAVDYINQNSDLIADMTISDIADNAFVSTSTISKAIRKCGYENFAKLRYHIVSQKNPPKNVVLANEILLKSYDECIKTIESIQIDSILRISDYIHKANRIFVLACGNTSLVAQEFEFQMQCLRFNIWSISDTGIMKKMDKIACEGDLVIIFSVANSASELAVAAEMSKAQNAKIIVCCCEEHTSLANFADEYVLGYSHSITPNQLYGNSSRLALQIIARTIVEYLSFKPM